MKSPIHILYFEADPAAEQCVSSVFEKGGQSCDVFRVETRTALKKAIKERAFDVILAKYGNPSFDDMAALAIAQERCPELPFIFICGSLEEGLAIESLKMGATDYVLKDHLPRLVPSVLRALQEAEDRKQLQRLKEALRVSEAEFQDLFDNVLDGVYQISPDGKILSANPAMLSMLGYDSVDKLVNSSFADKLCANPKRWEARVRKSGKLREPASAEQVLKCRDGRLVNVLEHFRPVFDGQDRVIYYEGTLTDISELKGTEEALRESEAKLRILVENYNDALYVLQDKKFVFVNPKFEELLGYTFEEISSLDCDQSKPLFVQDGNLFDPNQADQSGFNFTTLSKSGESIDFEVRISSILWDCGPAILGSMRDVTDRNRLEQQLRQTSKLEAIGGLAGGVAHDFNNLLTIINGFAEFVLNSPDIPDVLKCDLQEIQSAGRRGSDLTRQLLAFGRRQKLDVHVLDLNLIVHNMNKFLRRVIGEDIELETCLEEKLGSIKADLSQIENVIINLAVNARDAMPQGGILSVQTANVDLDDHYAWGRTYVKPGPYVLLTVSDSGTGITEDVMERIFEPFFTTKKNGEGTGLGLATVYGIVKQSGGYIWVYSEPRHGATFKIYFPRVSITQEDLTGPSGQKEMPVGSEAILVVEDEEAARKFTVKSLRKQGYKVFQAGGGSEALKIVGKNQNTIDLLLTDVVMPGMSGRQLGEKMLKKLPDLKVLYTSGYMDNTMVDYGILEPGVQFIQKPHSSVELAKKVREVLDSAQLNSSK